MKILHYSLGFPPFRRGGMTQYCIDLMLEQVEAGHSVALLWPGKLQNIGSRTKIKKRKKYELNKEACCESYELINPLPVPLMDGICNPQMYLIDKDEKIYHFFLKEQKFDVLHIHTFMGLPSELIDAAHAIGIKTVFTSHDYYPICPRCNFFHAGMDCKDDNRCANCVGCNQYGLSVNKIKFFQSDLYRLIKDNAFIKILRAQHNRKMYDVTEQQIEEELIDSELQNLYLQLRKKNICILENLDVVHFNSTNTLHRYKERGYSGKNAKVLSISNAAIQNHKEKRKLHTPIRFGYLGPLTTHKGYNLFQSACDTLWKDGIHEFEAHIYVQIENSPDYMKCHHPYKYSELKNVMDDIDILVAPSVCMETFGFTVLEALSYGIPVIVTDCVGASDLIEEGKNGFIIHTDQAELAQVMRHLLENKGKIKEMNQCIVDSLKIKTMKMHSKELERLYKIM